MQEVDATDDLRVREDLDVDSIVDDPIQSDVGSDASLWRGDGESLMVGRSWTRDTALLPCETKMGSSDICSG